MRIVIVSFALMLSACQSTDPAAFDVDRDCLQKKAGSKFLAKATGIGLGLAGVPGGGLVGRGVSMATDPRCQAVRPKVVSDKKRI